MTENEFPEKIKKYLVFNSIDHNKKIQKNFFIEKIIEEKNLESKFTSRRFDSFIATVLENIRRDSGGQDTVQFATTERKKTTFSSISGLSARVLESRGEEITVDEKKLQIERYTQIDFTPGQRTRFDSTKVSDSLANGIKGLVELVAAIDKGEVVLEPIFIGETNIKMALISQRLGFRIADSCRLPNGQIDKSKERFTVVGRLEDIRQKLAEFAQKGLTERILNRDARLRRIPQPA